MDGQAGCSSDVARAIDAIRQDGEADTAGNGEEGVSDAGQLPSQSSSTSPAAVNGAATDPELAAQDLHARRQSQLRKQNRFTQASVIIPPENFAYVEDGLYRSGQPTELNFPFLQRLQLKTLIWLAPEEPEQQFLDFMDEEQITLAHLGMLQAANARDPVAEDVVLRALDILLQPSSYPVMVMCNLGRHRTGTVIGCFRRLQRWNLASTFEEYRRHAGARVRLVNEQFIELFDLDLVRVPQLPVTGQAEPRCDGAP